jgi:hypothetical protein
MCCRSGRRLCCPWPRYDYHQPIPTGLLAVVLSRCARLCGADTTVWRDALSTIITHDAAPPSAPLAIELSVWQESHSCVLLQARCEAGAHHAECLRRLRL